MPIIKRYDLVNGASSADFSRRFFENNIEILSLLVYSASLGLFAYFLPTLLPFLIIVASLIVCYTFVKTFKLANPIVVAVCGGLSILFPLSQVLLNFNFLSTGAIMVPFICYIACVFIITFGVQIVRNVRENTLETVGFALVLSLIITSNWGFLLTNNFYQGLLTPIIILFCLLNFIPNLILLPIDTIAHYGLKARIDYRCRYVIKLVLMLIVASIYFFALNDLFSYQLSITITLITTLIPIIATLITVLQYGKGQYNYIAVLRGLFPIVVSGIFVYLICIFSGVLVF